MVHTKGQEMVEKEQFKMNVPADLKGKLREIARRECRSLSAQIILMLRRQIEAQEANQK